MILFFSLNPAHIVKYIEYCLEVFCLNSVYSVSFSFLSAWAKLNLPHSTWLISFSVPRPVWDKKPVTSISNGDWWSVSFCRQLLGDVFTHCSWQETVRLENTVQLHFCAFRIFLKCSQALCGSTPGRWVPLCNQRFHFHLSVPI